MIQYVPEKVDRPNFQEKVVTRWIKTVAADYGKKCGDINFIFCTDERILEVNQQFLNHDYYTDIITFDYSNSNQISGDIFVSTETVKNNALELNIDYEQEILRILIHGILHLCGQDDQTPALRNEMINKENLALDKLHTMN